MIVCPYCQQRVDPDKAGVWAKVEGWTQNRKAGGAHSVSYREEQGEYMHAECMTLRRLGIDAGQESLF